jgi:hypothetical protein
MKTEEQKKKITATKHVLIVRILAGAYLLYMVYELIRNWQDCEGMTLILSIVGAIAFVIVGVGFIVSSVYALQTGRYAGGALDDVQPDGEDMSPVEIRQETEENLPESDEVREEGMEEK